MRKPAQKFFHLFTLPGVWNIHLYTGMALFPAFALLLLWVLGVPVRYLASFFVVALLIDALTAGRRARVEGRSWMPLVLMVGCWSCIIFGVEVARLLFADQGIDFAIFTQAMGEYAARGEFQTSLVAPGWVNFLTHHFSPMLIVPGLLASNSFAVQLLAIALHALALGAALWGVVRLGRQRQLALGIIGICVASLILHPGMRIPALWEVHDEVYAAPFLVFGVLFLEQGRVRRALLCFVAAALCKETMLLLGAACCLGAWLADARSASLGRRFGRTERWVLCLASGVFILLFVLYTRILPGVIFNPSFSITERLVTAAQLFDLQLLRSKLWCAFTWVVFPMLLMLALQRRGAVECRLPRAAGAALLALGYHLSVLAVSNFDAMWNPYTYYQIIPVLLTGVLFITVVPQARLYRPSLVAAPLCLCFCFGATQGPVGPLLKEHELRENIAEVDRALPKTAVVIASDRDTAWLVGSRQVMRTYHANRSSVRFDYIVLRKGRREPLAEHLRSSSRLCFENSFYKVRCARSSVAADPELVRSFISSRQRLAQIPLPQRG